MMHCVTHLKVLLHNNNFSQTYVGLQTWIRLLRRQETKETKIKSEAWSVDRQERELTGRDQPLLSYSEIIHLITSELRNWSSCCSFMTIKTRDTWCVKGEPRIYTSESVYRCCGELLQIWKELYNAFCGFRGSCSNSDKLPHLSQCQLWPKDYKFENLLELERSEFTGLL